jgi:hypothetical protein
LTNCQYRERLSHVGITGDCAIRGDTPGENNMTKFRRLLLVALMLAVPIVASSCAIAVGPCTLYVEEPGIANGLFCPI